MENQISDITNIMLGIFSMLGVIFFVAGLHNMYKSSQGAGQEAQGLAKITAGSLLIVVSSVFPTMTSSIDEEKYSQSDHLAINEHKETRVLPEFLVQYKQPEEIVNVSQDYVSDQVQSSGLNPLSIEHVDRLLEKRNMRLLAYEEGDLFIFAENASGERVTLDVRAVQ